MKPRKFNGNRTSEEDRNLIQVKCYVPTEFFDLLKVHSRRTGIPVPRLVAIALDNEISSGLEAFTYPIECPDIEFIESAYLKEAGKLLQIIQKYPKGVGREMLMLYRHSLGLDKDQIMLAVRELLMAGLIKDVNPTWFKPGMQQEDYTVLRCVTVEEKENEGLTPQERRVQRLEKALEREREKARKQKTERIGNG